MEAYRQYQEARQVEDLSVADSSDEGWDDLARLVANQVMVHLQDSPLQSELGKMRAKLDEYYRDNRAMAEQVKQLTEENEQLRKSVSSCEMEVACYRHLVGNLYLKL